MEQRRLRLGDILDDYCPRERRLTNHAVVAMIEEDVRQTRCTTCDAEHVYKGGKVPRRKKKDSAEALYKEVLAGMPEEPAPILATVAQAAEPATPRPEAAPALPLMPPAVRPAPRFTPVESLPPVPEPEDDLAGPEPESAPAVEEGPVHRRLIRAQLPRIEGHKEERRLPEFTIRQTPAGRPGAGFRGSGANGNNARAHGAHRFAATRPGASGRPPGGRGGAPSGFRGAGQPRPGGPRKRSR